MHTIFINGNEYPNSIEAWVFSSNQITPLRRIYKHWDEFNKTINEICLLIKNYKPIQIIFEENSEYEDSIWDAVTSKCNNELDIGIDNSGKITYYETYRLR